MADDEHAPRTMLYPLDPSLDPQLVWKGKDEQDRACGSGTTAYVAEQWGRRWITCDTSRVALALARTRLMAAKYPYYYLADAYPQITQISTDLEIKEYLRKSAKSADKSLPSADARDVARICFERGIERVVAT